MPDRPLRSFVFKGVYHEIAMVEQTLADTFVLGELPWDDAVLLECLAKFSKVTLLHWYVFYALERINKASFMQDSDLVADDPSITDELEERMTAYGVSFTPYA